MSARARCRLSSISYVAFLGPVRTRSTQGSIISPARAEAQRSAQPKPTANLVHGAQRTLAIEANSRSSPCQRCRLAKIAPRRSERGWSREEDRVLVFRSLVGVAVIAGAFCLGFAGPVGRAGRRGRGGGRR